MVLLFKTDAAICVRIWLNSDATKFNIISKEYNNKKGGIFIDTLQLTFNDDLV